MGFFIFPATFVTFFLFPWEGYLNLFVSTQFCKNWLKTEILGGNLEIWCNLMILGTQI